MKTSITQNKHLTPQLKEDNDPISTEFAAQILFLNLEYTLFLLNSLITGLCDSWTSASFTFFLDPVFLSKNLCHTH